MCGEPTRRRDREAHKAATSSLPPRTSLAHVSAALGPSQRHRHAKKKSTSPRRKWRFSATHRHRFQRTRQIRLEQTKRTKPTHTAKILPKTANFSRYFACFPAPYAQPTHHPQTLCQPCFQSDSRIFSMLASLGLEPRQADSESAVLPLHHEAVRAAESRRGAGQVKHILSRCFLQWRR